MRTASGDARALSSVPLPATELATTGGEGTSGQARWADFEAFVRDAEPKLSRALGAAYGFEDGRDATAEALAYAFEHWAQLQHIANLPGYLFRVGQSRGRRRRQPVVFAVPESTDYAFEPGLPEALASLTQRQRLAVVLVHGYGYTLREVAELTGIRPTTVQNHLARGLARLRSRMGVTDGS
jgi:DNA-directed RNA polymerase specialized sigma24 family protein